MEFQFKRLFPNFDETQTSGENDNSESNPVKENVPLDKEIDSGEDGESGTDIEKEFENLNKMKKAKVDTPKPSSFREEILAFENDMVLGQRLQALKHALESIPPTSILPERAFSLAENFVRRRRNRISEDLLDSLMFLKMIL